MEIVGGFKVEISSSYEYFWRYNVAVTCGCFDGGGNRVGFASADDHLADVGAGMKTAPKGFVLPRTVTFSTVPCERLLMYIYVIPHTLPEGRDVAEYKPFDMTVRVTRDGRNVLTKTYSVNSWSGASIELSAEEKQQ